MVALYKSLVGVIKIQPRREAFSASFSTFFSSRPGLGVKDFHSLQAQIRAWKMEFFSNQKMGIEQPMQKNTFCINYTIWNFFALLVMQCFQCIAKKGPKFLSYSDGFIDILNELPEVEAKLGHTNADLLCLPQQHWWTFFKSFFKWHPSFCMSNTEKNAAQRIYLKQKASWKKMEINNICLQAT